MAGTKKASKTQVEALLTGAILSTSANTETQSVMAQMIANMNLTVPVKATPAEPKTADKREKPVRIPQLSQVEMLIITAMSAPNEWFLAHTSKRRRADIGFRGMGSAFEMVTRKEDGAVRHYIRYTGKPCSPAGEQRIARLRSKLELIQQIAEGKVKVSGPKGKRTAHSSSASIDVARRWPLNKTEEKFLRLLATPNTTVLLEQGVKTNQIWHTFRWKWQTRYGFDLSQCAFSQTKREDGTYDIYGFYKPNADGSMNPGLRDFVKFLESKPATSAKASRSASSTPEATGPKFRFGRQHTPEKA